MASEGVELGYPGWRLDCAVPGSGGSRPTIQLPSSSYDPTRRSKRQRVERVAVKREPEDHCTDAEPRTSGTTATTAAAATPAPYGADAAVSQAAPADAPFAWEWKLGHGRWARYNTEIEAKIEKLYQARSTGRLDVNGSMYTIDTARLRQTNNDTGYHRDLRRKSLLASSAAPSTQDGSPRARAVGQADDASGVVPSGAVRPVGDDAAATTAPDNLAMVALGSKQVDAAEKRVAAAKLQERRALQLLEDARKKIKVEEKQLYLSKQLLKNACITAGTAYPASLSPVTGGSTTARPSSGAAHSLGDHAADLASMSLSAATRTEAPKDVASFRASSATVVAGERGRGGSSGRPSASSSSSSSSEEDSSCSSDDDDDDDGDNGASSISSAAATASPPVAIATYGRRGAPVFTKPGSNIAASRADRRRSSSPQSAAGMATSRSDTCQSAAGGKRGHGGHSLPGFGQAATTLTDRVHRRKPRRLVLHYNSGLGSDAPATRGALPTGLVATCALDGSIVFSALYAGVPALGRSGLRLCSAGTLTTETLLGTSGTSKHTPEDLGFGPDYLLAVYRGISPQAAGGTSARRQQAVPQVAVIDARKLVKGQKGGRGGAPKLSSSPIRAYCLKETPHAQGAGPSAVATLPLPAGSSGAADESASRRSFVTGGVDHAVHLWIMKGGSGWLAKKTLIQPLHRQHTAQVLTLCVPDCERVLSGGADKRVVLHSLGAPGGSGATLGTLTLDARVNRILCRDTAILVSTCTPTDQLYLFDARTIGQGSGKSHATTCLGWRERKEGSQISALTAPSWSICGNLIACGTASGCVNVWDVRMTRVDRADGGVMPIESFDAHAHRVMVRGRSNSHSFGGIHLMLVATLLRLG